MSTGQDDGYSPPLRTYRFSLPEVDCNGSDTATFTVPVGAMARGSYLIFARTDCEFTITRIEHEG